MADVREPAGLGFKIVTVLTILFFLAVVAALIRTYDSGSEVTATGPTVTTPVASASAQPATQVPVGAVATGGGGTAGDVTGTALPVFIGLAAVTMFAAGGLAVRRRTA